MNRKEHVEFATKVALGTYYQETKRLGIKTEWWHDAIAEAVAICIGQNIGTLPDWLEPPISPVHRSIFHSKGIYKVIEGWKQLIITNPTRDWWRDVFYLMALSAYQSHLALDSTTKMGIP